jgi:hypothetical protein
MKKHLTLIGLLLLSLNVSSQVIKNVDFNFVDDKIVIFYDLVDCDSKYKYDIDIKFVDDRGNTVIPRILSGDYGRVSCGKNNRVEWDPFQEMSTFEGNYKVTVNIVNVYDRFGKPVMLSSKENQQKTQKSFDVSAYGKFLSYSNFANVFSAGFSIDYYLFNRNLIVGSEVGYTSSIFNQKIDLSIFLGTTPRLLNNNYLSVGLMVSPISYEYVEPGEEEYYDEYGPRVGIYGCLEFGRVKIIPGIAGCSHETVYINWGSDPGSWLLVYFAAIKIRIF